MTGQLRGQATSGRGQATFTGLGLLDDIRCVRIARSGSGDGCFGHLASYWRCAVLLISIGT